MVFDPQLKRQFTYSVAMATSTATANIYGEISVGAATSVYMRVEPHQQEYELADGTTLRSSHKLFHDADSGITPTFDSRFWLEGLSSSSAGYARKPLRIHAVHADMGKLSHFVIVV